MKINWKEQGLALWTAVRPILVAGLKPLLWALLGVGVGAATGCSSLTPSSKTQTMSVWAFGIPGIAVITQSGQAADAAGADTNAPTQTNPTTVTVPIK